jgi:hypothetical protein
MTEPMGLLITAFNYAKASEDEFHDWYDLEHIPQRLAIPGFIRAERWLGAEDARLAAATYELENIDVLKSVPYLAISGENLSPWSKRLIGMAERIARFDAIQILPGRELGPPDADGMLIVAMNVLSEAEEEFNAWYDEEHIPLLKTVPGVLSARRFRSVAGTRKYIAVYHLSQPGVQASETWAKTIATPWRAKIRPLTSDRLRLVLRRYRRRAEPAA